VALKAKTSIYVDEELWRLFKKRAALRGLDISSLLEEAMWEEVGVSAELERFVGQVGEEVGVDFDPVEVEGGLVSELIGEMRRGRTRVPR